MTAPMTSREALQDALDEWARANLPTESAGCITSWSDWIAAFVCDGVFGDSQMHPLSDIRDLDEAVRELGIQDSSTTPAEAVRELNAEIERLRSVAKEDWQEDPSADERWNAGCTFAMLQLCHALGVDPQSISWDAATETLDGDVCAVIWNILRAKMGENWDPHAIPDPAKTGRDPDLDNADVACQELCGRYGFATGHGDTITTMIKEIDAQIGERLVSMSAQGPPSPTAAELLDALLSRIDFDGMDANTFTISELRKAI